MGQEVKRKGEADMADLRLCDSEYRFMCLVWELSPVGVEEVYGIHGAEEACRARILKE